MPSDTILHKAANKGDLDEIRSYLGEKCVDKDENAEIPVGCQADADEQDSSDLSAEAAPQAEESTINCKEGPETEEVDEPDVDERGAQERTALMRACGAGHVECVNFLLSRGADVCKTDKVGRTALHYAAIGGHCEVLAKLLVLPQVDAVAVTCSGTTALHGAVAAKSAPIVKQLVTKVRDASHQDTTSEEECEVKVQNFFQHKNNEDKSAWDLALAAKDREMCTALKDAGDNQAKDASCCIM